MKRKLTLLIAVIVVLSMLFTSCMRQRPASADEETPGSESGESIGGSEQPSSNEPAESIQPGDGQTLSADELVPFAQEQGQDILYGYMDPEGNTVIEPKFASAELFHDCGLAIVGDTDGKAGLIDKTGEFVVKSDANYIYYYDGVFSGYSDEEKTSYVYDGKGNLVFSRPGYLGSFSDGMSAYYGDTERGYLDSKGELITVSYDNLGDFKDGMARVAESYNGPSVYIDKKGNDLTDSVSSGIRVVQDTDTSLMGYDDKDGNPITEKVFSEADPFKDGLAIVNASPDSQTRYGIIDEKGNYVLEPKYTGIQRMRNGSFAVGPELTDDAYVPSMFFNEAAKAVFSKDLKNHTEWVYTIVDDCDSKYVCVNDGSKISYYDADLNKPEDMPEFKGAGSMLAEGDRLRGSINNMPTLADREGNILTQDHQLRLLDGGIRTTTTTEYPSAHVSIGYPVLEGMEDKGIQDKMNKLIRDNAMSGYASPSEDTENTEDPYSFPVVYTDSSVKITKNLLQVDHSVEEYWMGAAHGAHYRDIMFVNIQNGDTYTLKDLFKSPDEALQKLSDIINEKISEQPDGGFLVDAVTPDQINFFYLNGNGITLYFGEYEIACYAAGMPEFEIPFSDISDFINYDGEFWKSFN